MVVLINFMHRGRWSFHCLAQDAKTVLTPWMDVSSQATMLRLFRACGATDEDIAEVERKISVMGRGTLWLNVDERGKKLLRIRE